MLTIFIRTVELVDEPFAYLAKKADPVSLLHAVEYICSNELTNNIFVIHICDDRKALGMYNQFCKQARQQVTLGKLPSSEVESYCDKLFLQMFHKDSHVGTDSDSYMDTLPSEAKRLIKHVAVLDAFYA